jgi:hypothetical protein
MTASIHTSITFLQSPHIVAEPLGGFYVVLPNGSGWLLGSRQQALHEFALLERIERTGFAQKRRS